MTSASTTMGSWPSRFGSGALLPVALLLAWQWLGTTLGTPRTPLPTRIVREAITLIASGDLPLAILSALVDAQHAGKPSIKASVPAVPRGANPIYEPVCSDNYA